MRYIEHHEIDKAKWDDCIMKAPNGIVFGYSWFLDAVFDNWDALIWDDYEAVFPITKKSRFCINYFFNPIFALQLGIFSKVELTNNLMDQFILSLPKSLKLIDVSLNFGNYVDSQSFEITDRRCQFIDLSCSYDEIYANYSTNLKRNLKKAKKNHLKIVLSDNIDNVVQLFRENRGESLKEIKEEHYQRLYAVLDQFKQRKLSRIYECWIDNELIASACFSITNNRIIYIKGGSTLRGRELGAMHLLMDEVIRINSNSKLVYDFGGSSIEKVARFNGGFGVEEYTYQRLYRNNLPFFIKMFKK